MKKILILMLSILVFGLSAIGYAADVQPGVTNSNWDNGVIQATGVGFAPSNVTNASQAKFLSRRGAVTDARRNLLEILQEVRIDSETIVSDLQVKDNITSKVSGVIKGARIVSEQATEDGGYTVIMEIRMYGENSVAAAVLTNPGVVQTLPEPTFVPANNQTTMPDYTGIVIDARGLNLERVMSPGLYDDKGRIIYGHKYIDTDRVVKYGMVDYITDDTISEVTSGKSRAGSNPLIIKALSVKDFNANIVISEDDANKILIANKQTNFLAKTAVVFEQ